MNKMFKAFLSDENNLVLTWREQGDLEPIPSLLTQTLELRQKMPLYYPLSDDFKELSDDFTQRLIRLIGQLQSQGRPEKLEDRLTSSLTELLNRQMLPLVTMKENKTLLKDLIAYTAKKISPDIISLLQEADKAPKNERQVFIKAHLADFIRPQVLQAYGDVASQDESRVLRFSLTHIPYQITQKID